MLSLHKTLGVGCGIVAVGVGVYALLPIRRRSYVVLGSSAALLVINFLFGMALTDYKSKFSEDLHQTLSGQLTSQLSDSNSELWDFVQIEMACCGIDNYHDYNKVPISCCVLQQRYPLPVPDRLDQCQHDVQLNVMSSTYLNVKGCLSPLSRWLVRHINVHSALLFGCLLLQSLSVLLQTWKVYHQVKPNHD